MERASGGLGPAGVAVKPAEADFASGQPGGEGQEGQADRGESHDGDQRAAGQVDRLQILGLKELECGRGG